MRLKAQIVIDIEAADFGEAAEHQRRVELAFETVREVYPEAQLDFRQRRRFARPRLQRGTFRVGRM